LASTRRGFAHKIVPNGVQLCRRLCSPLGVPPDDDGGGVYGCPHYKTSFEPLFGLLTYRERQTRWKQYQLSFTIAAGITKYTITDICIKFQRWRYRLMYSSSCRTTHSPRLWSDSSQTVRVRQRERCVRACVQSSDHRNTSRPINNRTPRQNQHQYQYQYQLLHDRVSSTLVQSMRHTQVRNESVAHAILLTISRQGWGQLKFQMIGLSLDVNYIRYMLSVSQINLNPHPLSCF